MSAVGAGVLIGHTALAVLTPLALLALGLSYRTHGQPVALGLGGLAVLIAYLHVFGSTPEWTLYLVLAASVLAAGLDWQAGRSASSRRSALILGRVRFL